MTGNFGGYHWRTMLSAEWINLRHDNPADYFNEGSNFGPTIGGPVAHS
jgi:hypothetical protein